jgi:hypothetical protein
VPPPLAVVQLPQEHPLPLAELVAGSCSKVEEEEHSHNWEEELHIEGEHSHNWEEVHYYIVEEVVVCSPSSLWKCIEVNAIC